MAGHESVNIAETNSSKLLYVFVLWRLKLGSVSHIPLTASQSHKQWIVSSGCSSHKLQTLSGVMCRENKLPLVGKDSIEARHMKCLTLLGTFNFQILF